MAKITQPVPGSAQSIGSFSNGLSSVLTRCRYSPNIIRSCVPSASLFRSPRPGDVYPASESPVSNLGMGTVLIGDMGMPAGVVSTAVTPATRPDWMSISSCTAENTLDLRATLAPASVRFSSRDGKHVVPTLWKPEIFSLTNSPPRIKTSRAFLLIRRLSTTLP